MESSPLIFVVDDTHAARRATGLVLEKAGFRVAEAADGATALRCIPDLNPDLVLLDVVLPDIGGVEVLRRLRTEPRLTLTSVVLLSSQLTQAADQAEGLDAGADGYIARPISNVELVARVRALLRSQKLSRQLRESEARFRELITQQTDGLLVVDADGCIQFANPAAAQIFERKTEDLIGYPFGFSISSGATVELDVPGAAAPGRIVEVRASSTRWADQPAHLISLRDVTGQRRAERSLRESEKRLSGIFQQSAAGIFLASADGRYIRVNQRFCEIMGCTEAEILTCNCTETTHPDDRPRESSMTATMAEGGFASPSWDKRYLRQDGSVIWTNLTLSLLRDEENGPHQYVGVVIDITQRKIADELVRTRARQQETIARIGFEATRTTTLQGIFDFATSAIAEALGVELCKVLQLAPDGSHLRLVSGVGWQAGLIGVGTVGVDRESQAGFTLKSDGAIYVNDFARETRFTAPPLLRDHEVVSGLSVKIKLRDRPWGVLGAHCRTVRTFNDVDADFMQSVATLLAVVIERLAVQRTLTESESRMRDAQRIAHLGNWEVDIANDELSWSEEVFRIFGVEPSMFAATYENFLALVHPDDREAMQAAQQAVRSGRGRLDIEHRIIRPDGSIRHVRERGELILDENGRAVALSGTVLDTTDLRAAQSQAERMNALLTEAQRIAAMGSWEMDMATGRLSWPDETCRLFGIQPEEFGGTFETFTGFILPEDMAAYSAVHAGITPEAPLLEAEYRIRRADGEVRWMFERGRVMFEPAGKAIRRLGVVMDVTERKRAEEQLKSSSNRLTLATQAGGVGIWDYEVACNRLTWDSQMYRLYGIEHEQFSGAYEAWTAGVHPEDRRRGDEEFQQALRGEKNFDTEFRVLWPDGSTHQIRALAIVERDAAGRAVRIVGTNWDITERKRAEAELRESGELLRIAGRIARMGAWKVDFPEVRITWSDEVCAIHDMPAGTVPALDRALDYYTPESRPIIESAFSLCASEGTPFDVEIELQSAKGQRRWVRSIGQAERDQTGAIRRVSGAFQDITDQRLAQKKLLQDGSLRRIAGAIGKIGGWSVSVPDYHLDWSEEIYDIVEYPPGPVPSLEKALELYPEPWQSQLGAAITACATGGAPIDMELMIRSAKGRLFWARCMAEAEIDAKGRIVQVRGAFQDISEQKAADEKIRDLGGRIVNTLETITDGFFTLDREWRFTYVNAEAEKLLGRQRSTLLGLSVWQTHPEAVGSPFERQYRQAVATQTTATFEEYYPPLGVWVEVKAYPSQEGLAVYFHNVTESHRLNEALRASESKFRQLAESNILGLLFWNAQGGITDANDAFLRMVGYTREELTNGQIDWRNMTPPEYLAQDERVLAELAAGGNCPPFEKEYFHKDGHRVAIVLGATTLDGAKDYGICYVVDISAQKQAEATIRVSEERFRLLSKATKDAIWDWNLITNELWWNEGFEHMFGYTRADGEPTLKQWSDRLHPEDLARVTDGIHRAIEHGSEGWSDEYRFRCKDGRYAYVLDRGHVIRDATGKPVRMIGGMTDLSDRRAAEERLKEQATLLDKAQDAILVRDLEHHILYWNRSAERLYGWTATEAVGRSVRELLYRDRAAFDEAVKDALACGEWVGEIEQYTKSGEKVSVEGHWTVVRDDQGKPTSILAINTDISQRKKLEQQFLRAQRMESIGTLAGGIAHDLNNLLAPISMGVDLLLCYPQDAKAHTIIDTIGRSAKRGADLVKQVLSFARGVEGERVSIQVLHVIREIVSIVENTFPKNIRLDIKIPDRIWLISGDPTQMNQVFLNLAVNARDAMPEGGTLTISAENIEVDQQYSVMNRGVSVGRYVVISVTDTGMGIPREIMDRIFDPFFTTKEVGKGTGLGLSTVIGIARSHGGFINVYSEPGIGSTFKVYLPAQIDDDSGKEKKAADAEQFPRGNGELILVVDDEASILDITKQTLEAFGYRVITASDGAQAIGQFALARDRVKLVLTDMMMPVMDGPALIAALRRIEPHVRIIAASGLNANGNVAKASNLGVKHFLPKPYSANTMLVTLQRVLAENALPRPGQDTVGHT